MRRKREKIKRSKKHPRFSGMFFDDRMGNV